MITLKTVGVDTATTGPEPAVSIETPVGIDDGDLILVGIVALGGGVAVTPPAGWEAVSSTDPSLAAAISVFSRTALNEGARWVFRLSPNANALAAAAVYSGADGWEPVEASTPDTATASTTAPVASVATSIPDEEVVAFVGSDLTSAPTSPDATYAEAASHTSASGAITLARGFRQAPGSLGSKLFVLGSSGASASVVIVLRPSAGELATDDVRQSIVSGLPQDVDRVYDLQPGGDYYKLFQAIAQAARETIFDLVDLLRQESRPATCVYKLPDWERVFGLTATSTAKIGTVPQRQAQVAASFRDAAGLGSTRDAITAIVGPLLGYFPTTPVQVVTTDRDLLRLEHSYSPDELQTVSPVLVYQFQTVDRGKVSAAGVRVTFEYGTPPPLGTAITVTVTSPAGAGAIWEFNYDGQDIDVLASRSPAGGVMGPGQWALEVEVGSGSMTIIPTVFVEAVDTGFNSGQRTAAAMFDWGVYADPAHLGENGTPADFPAARRAISKIAFAFTQSGLIQSLGAIPDGDAIPDECIPA